MANQVSTVAFSAPTDYAAEAEDLERRRKLAEQLRLQGAQEVPRGTEVIGGWAIPRSPLEGLAGAIKQGVGAYQEGKLSDRKKELAKEQRDLEMSANQRFAAALRGDVGPVDPSYSPSPEAEALGMSQTAPRSPMTQEQRQNAALEALASHPNPAMRNLPIQLQLAQLMKGGAGDTFAKINPKDFTPDSVRAFAASGGKDYSLLQPLKPLHFADTGSGIQGVDPFTGAPRGDAIPKNVSPDAAARIAQQERQWSNLSPYQQEQLRLGQGNLNVAQGNLGLRGAEVGLHNINTQFNTGQGLPSIPAFQGGSGPVAPPGAPTGQPGAPSAPPAIVAPPRVPGGGNPNLVVDPAVQAQRDAEAARIRSAEGQPGGGGLIPIRNVIPGARVSDPAAAAAPSTGPRPIIEQVTPKERQDMLKAKPQEEAGATTFLQKMDNIKNTAAELREHRGVDSITGKTDQYSFMDLRPQTRAARGLQNKLVAQVGIQALQEMRNASKTGGAVGNVTEKEWPILQQSIAALDGAQSPSDYKIALQNLENQIQTSMDRVHKAYEQTYGGKLDYTPTPYVGQNRASSAPKAMLDMSAIDAELKRRQSR